jgi:hypothetical protein
MENNKMSNPKARSVCVPSWSLVDPKNTRPYVDAAHTNVRVHTARHRRQEREQRLAEHVGEIIQQGAEK